MLPKIMIVGFCIMPSKLNRPHVKKLIERISRTHTVTLFSCDLILNIPITKWPYVDVLISFYHTSLPFSKVCSYVDFFKVSCVNDLFLQYALLDRRFVYKVLDVLGVSVDGYFVVNRCVNNGIVSGGGIEYDKDNGCDMLSKCVFGSNVGDEFLSNGKKYDFIDDSRDAEFFRQKNLKEFTYDKKENQNIKNDRGDIMCDKKRENKISYNCRGDKLCDNKREDLLCNDQKENETCNDKREDVFTDYKKENKNFNNFRIDNLSDNKREDLLCNDQKEDVLCNVISLKKHNFDKKLNESCNNKIENIVLNDKVKDEFFYNEGQEQVKYKSDNRENECFCCKYKNLNYKREDLADILDGNNKNLDGRENENLNMRHSLFSDYNLQYSLKKYLSSRFNTSFMDIDKVYPESFLIETDEYIEFNGKRIYRPFVEKPIDAEDHNIYIYYTDGSTRKLFRKKNNKSSEIYTDSKYIRRHGSFIYEPFLDSTDKKDIKVYALGKETSYAESRKSPTVDGIVERDENGKERRDVVKLSESEYEYGRRICLAFKQNICGFDILRSGSFSYVIDVNGWSFVKTGNNYYDLCIDSLKKEFDRMLNCKVQYNEDDKFYNKIVRIYRHGDRTPKQKIKVKIKGTIGLEESEIVIKDDFEETTKILRNAYNEMIKVKENYHNIKTINNNDSFNFKDNTNTESHKNDDFKNNIKNNNKYYKNNRDIEQDNNQNDIFKNEYFKNNPNIEPDNNQNEILINDFKNDIKKDGISFKKINKIEPDNNRNEIFNNDFKNNIKNNGISFKKINNIEPDNNRNEILINDFKNDIKNNDLSFKKNNKIESNNNQNETFNNYVKKNIKNYDEYFKNNRNIEPDNNQNETFSNDIENKIKNNYISLKKNNKIEPDNNQNETFNNDVKKNIKNDEYFKDNNKIKSNKNQNDIFNDDDYKLNNFKDNIFNNGYNLNNGVNNKCIEGNADKFDDFKNSYDFDNVINNKCNDDGDKCDDFENIIVNNSNDSDNSINNKCNTFINNITSKLKNNETNSNEKDNNDENILTSDKYKSSLKPSSDENIKCYKMNIESKDQKRIESDFNNKYNDDVINGILEIIHILESGIDKKGMKIQIKCVKGSTEIILKWGGVITHTGRHQSTELGETLRYALTESNEHLLEEIKIYSSSESRVYESAKHFIEALEMKNKGKNESLTLDNKETMVEINKNLLDDTFHANGFIEEARLFLKDAFDEYKTEEEEKCFLETIINLNIAIDNYNIGCNKKTLNDNVANSKNNMENNDKNIINSTILSVNEENNKNDDVKNNNVNINNDTTLSINEVNNRNVNTINSTEASINQLNNKKNDTENYKNKNVINGTTLTVNEANNKTYMNNIYINNDNDFNGRGNNIEDDIALYAKSSHNNNYKNNTLIDTTNNQDDNDTIDINNHKNITYNPNNKVVDNYHENMTDNTNNNFSKNGILDQNDKNNLRINEKDSSNTNKIFNNTFIIDMFISSTGKNERDTKELQTIKYRWWKLRNKVIKDNQMTHNRVSEIYDNLKYDLVHNNNAIRNIIGKDKIVEFYILIKKLNSFIIQNEYGKNKEEKVKTSKAMSIHFMEKIINDLKTEYDKNQEIKDEQKNKKYAGDLNNESESNGKTVKNNEKDDYQKKIINDKTKNERFNSKYKNDLTSDNFMEFDRHSNNERLKYNNFEKNNNSKYNNIYKNNSTVNNFLKSNKHSDNECLKYNNSEKNDKSIKSKSNNYHRNSLANDNFIGSNKNSNNICFKINNSDILKEKEDKNNKKKGKTYIYFTKESRIYTMFNILNYFVNKSIKVKEFGYGSMIGIDLYEQNGIKKVRVVYNRGVNCEEILDGCIDSRHRAPFREDEILYEMELENFIKITKI